MVVMEETASNSVVMEKFPNFSLPVALQQMLNLGLKNPQVTNFEKYLSLPKWSRDVVESCLNDLTDVLLCERSVDDLFEILSPILIELLQRASHIQKSTISPRVMHQTMCVLLGKLIRMNKGILQ